MKPWSEMTRHNAGVVKWSNTADFHSVISAERHGVGSNPTVGTTVSDLSKIRTWALGLLGVVTALAMRISGGFESPQGPQSFRSLMVEQRIYIPSHQISG